VYGDILSISYIIVVKNSIIFIFLQFSITFINFVKYSRVTTNITTIISNIDN